MAPPGFHSPPDGTDFTYSMYTPLGDGATWTYDFNVTPISGHDMTNAKGALFNVELTFPAGVNVLGFQQMQGVSRTFYSDGAANEYFWGDSSNDHPGVPNSVTVE